MVVSFDEFCGGIPFINETLLLDNSYPQFTECFQNTVLVWVPCGILWITLPLYIRFLIKKGGTTLRLSGLNISKTCVSLLLFVITLVDVIYVATHVPLGGVIYPAAFYTAAAISAATFMLTAVLVQLERIHGAITSGILFIFWFTLSITRVVPIYTQIMEKEYDESLLWFVLTVFNYALVIIQLILSSFVEKVQIQGYSHTDKAPCPEMYASFPSKFTFWWITPLIVRVYRTGVVEDDLWDLNPEDQSSTIAPELQKSWDTEVNKHKSRHQHGPTAVALENSFMNRDIQSERPLLLGETRQQIENRRHTGETTSDKKIIKGLSLFRVLAKVFGKEILVHLLLKMIYDFLLFANPMILSVLIGFVEAKNVTDSSESDVRVWKGYIYAAAIFVVSTAQSLVLQNSFNIVFKTGMRLKSSLMSAIYKKALLINSEARKTSTVGEIVNLMAVDAKRLQDTTSSLWVLLSAPLQVTVAMVLLWQQLGRSVLAGIVVLFFIVPLNAIFAWKQRKLQVDQMHCKDSRLKTMNEVLNGMKVLKLYAWESSFERKIHDIRDKELNVIKRFAFLNGASVFFWSNASLMVAMATFMTYVLSDSTNYLDAQKIFVSLTLFKILSAPFNQLPMLGSQIVQGLVSLCRIEKFLLSDELDPENVNNTNDSDTAVSIQDGTFSWGMKLEPTLESINFTIPEGQLVAVVGQVGSGKSSLLSAVLGEMEKLEGQVNVKGSKAYVPQQAWIQNATVRSNVLFGLDMEEDKYHEVIQACALEPDLEILQGGDMTEIGEKGINLSGGQKQRVSLARAVYNNADLYLLDDPLSAVDSHVGKHIFDNVIGSKGLLKNKTRVLVTHGVHWLPMVDSIIVLIDGRITEMGSYEELMSHDGAFAQFLKTYLTQNYSEDEDEDPEVHQLKTEMLDRVGSVTSLTSGGSDGAKVSRSSLHDPSTLPGGNVSNAEVVKERTIKLTDKLIQTEKTELGDVSWRVYLTYFKATGYIASGLLFLSMFIYQTFSVASSVWLAGWTDDPFLKNNSNANTTQYSKLNYKYLGIYGVLGAGQACMMLMYSFLAAVKMVRATRLLHNNMLSNILRLPMSFFDTTPLGRIVNRFSRDVDIIDNTLWQNIRAFLMQFYGTLSVFVVIGYSTPLFNAILLPVAVFYYIIQKFYIPSSRQLRRIESTSRSPIFSHFSESIQGVSTIRAYGVQESFIEQSQKNVDKNIVFYFSQMTTIRWLALRLDVLGNLITLAAALFAVTSRDVSAGLVGLSVSYAIQMTSSLKFLVRCASDVETNFVSVERVNEYTVEETEAEWIQPSNRPPHDWPQDGNVRFNDYSTRYREGLNLVLKGISCDIQAGDRVGIVGRTGAGKSSLTVALFRIIEAAGGSIVIDGERISDMGLHDLRARITILPQEPVLFSGTLRMNLDPFDKATDAQVWQALEHAHLKSFVSGLPGQLQHECGEGGQNLSVGQRQLVCLARTLLRKTKVLVFDEATAAVDMETDDLIQKTIREEFKDCTILTIAHRLNTIMDYDKILVLDEGTIKEFDTTRALLQDKSSAFYCMAKNAGLV